MKSLSAAALAIALASAAVAQAQGRPPTDGVARAGSNAGSSAVTPSRAASPKNAKPARSSTAKHRLAPDVAGMGSQAANTTGATSNSH